MDINSETQPSYLGIAPYVAQSGYYTNARDLDYIPVCIIYLKLS